jgi:hypothetical protein
MTKVQLRFRLQKPLDDLLLQRISDAHSLYGLYRVKLTPDEAGIFVEYDATRLRPAEVEAALAGAGIPLDPLT